MFVYMLDNIRFVYFIVYLCISEYFDYQALPNCNGNLSIEDSLIFVLFQID